MQQSKITADIKRNRVDLQLVGRVTRQELEHLYTELRFCVADLKNGFDVLSDFSRCQLIYINGLPTFRKMMHYLALNGVREVVRILDSERVVARQIINFTGRIQGYKPIYATTREEAEERLLNSVRRKGMRFFFQALPVTYVFGGDQSDGKVIDMSISGLAVSATSSLPVKGDSITLRFQLLGPDGSTEDFEIHAEVVRVDAQTFAAAFKNIEKKDGDRLWQSLLIESQRDIEAA